MAKTKTTPRNEYRRCPMCSEPARTEEEFKKHIMVCAMRVFECPTCDFTNTRELNLKRHIKRCHPGLGPNDELIKLGAKEQSKEKAGGSLNEKNKNEESANEDWLDQDPGEVIGEISSADSSSSSSSSEENEEDDIDEQKEKQDPEKKEDNLLERRLFRKKTQPTLPFARKRPSLEDIPVPKKIILMDKATQVDMEPAVPPVESSGVDVYTQTSPKKREVVTRTTRKFREGEADIKVVAKERIIYN
ncbi:RE1-silencing transcription factor-like [Saccostrea echinata]|uniref:RE1-silencing transcription factor-like n=1 Tax=Saccostrea echinata TaxID=191078 RepID=UPI002A82298B|nr:RE1-silencing transcription factor-like [Saccostrea echinata]